MSNIHKWFFTVDIFTVVLVLDSSNKPITNWVRSDCTCDAPSTEQCRHLRAAQAALLLAYGGGSFRLPARHHEAIKRERVTLDQGDEPVDKEQWLDATGGKETVGGILEA